MLTTHIRNLSNQTFNVDKGDYGAKKMYANDDAIISHRHKRTFSATKIHFLARAHRTRGESKIKSFIQHLHRMLRVR